jgi:hypothetical protein
LAHLSEQDEAINIPNDGSAASGILLAYIRLGKEAIQEPALKIKGSLHDRH